MRESKHSRLHIIRVYVGVGRARDTRSCVVIIRSGSTCISFSSLFVHACTNAHGRLVDWIPQ